MTDAPTTISDNLSNDLFAALTADADFTLPPIDLSGSEFSVPSSTDNPLYQTITRLTEADLTSREVAGAGMFDGIMESLAAHLQKEYDKNRLTGERYAEVYVALTTAALNTSTHFLLNRDTSHWQAQGAMLQAQAAEAEVVRTRLALEAARAQLQTSRLETQNAAANYALTKLNLATGDAEYHLTEAQLGKVNYEVNTILPAQKTGLDHQNATALYQHDNILPAQLAGMTVDTATKTYQKDHLLPAQKAAVDEQVEAHRAKTLDTRTDGVTPVAGAIGKQKELQDQQMASYVAADKTKFVKLMTDSWAVDKSIDEGVLTPAELNNTAIDTSMASLKATLSM